MGDTDVMAEPPPQFVKHHLIIDTCVQCTHNIPPIHVEEIGQFGERRVWTDAHARYIISYVKPCSLSLAGGEIDAVL